MKKTKDYFEYNSDNYESFIISFINVKFIKMSDTRIIIKYHKDEEVIIKKEDYSLSYPHFAALQNLIIAHFKIYKKNL